MIAQVLKAVIGRVTHSQFYLFEVGMSYLGVYILPLNQRGLDLSNTDKDTRPVQQFVMCLTTS